MTWSPPVGGFGTSAAAGTADRNTAPAAGPSAASGNVDGQSDPVTVRSGDAALTPSPLDGIKRSRHRAGLRGDVPRPGDIVVLPGEVRRSSAR